MLEPTRRRGEVSVETETNDDGGQIDLTLDPVGSGPVDELSDRVDALTAAIERSERLLRVMGGGLDGFGTRMVNQVDRTATTVEEGLGGFRADLAGLRADVQGIAAVTADGLARVATALATLDELRTVVLERPEAPTAEVIRSEVESVVAGHVEALRRSWPEAGLALDTTAIQRSVLDAIGELPAPAVDADAVRDAVVAAIGALPAPTVDLHELLETVVDTIRGLPAPTVDTSALRELRVAPVEAEVIKRAVRSVLAEDLADLGAELTEAVGRFKPAATPDTVSEAIDGLKEELSYLRRRLDNRSQVTAITEPQLDHLARQIVALFDASNPPAP